MKVEDGKVIKPCRGCHTDTPDLEEDCFLNCRKGCFKDSGVRTFGFDASRFLEPIDEKKIDEEQFEGSKDYYKKLIEERNTFLIKLKKEMERLKRFIDEKIDKDNKKD